MTPSGVYEAGLHSSDTPENRFEYLMGEKTYRQTSNISRTLVGNKIVDHSDVDVAPPVGAAPTTSSIST